MKPAYLVILLIVIAVSAFVGYKVYHRIQIRQSFERSGSAGGQSSGLGNQQEGTIPQSSDLCGGTGGNGEIVSLGNNTFILKLKNGTSRIIHLANEATIKTSTSSPSASESDLKIGDRVTLVGGPNPDGSFTANGVYVCK